MITRIQPSLISVTKSGTVVLEASDLGFSVGYWPTDIEYDSLLFSRWQEMSDSSGEFSGMEYKSLCGKVLRIYDD